MHIRRRNFLKSSLFVSLGMSLPHLKLRSAVKGKLLEEIQAHQNGIAVWWVGHNGWLIKSGNTLIGTDLPLETKAREAPSPISAAELASELNYSFVTHEHSDHFERETSKILLEKGNCTFVLPQSCVEAAREEVGIPDDRMIIAEPRKPFDTGDLHVEPVRAIHGNEKYAVYFEANLQDCGYLITMGGRRFFQPGDSVLLEDQLFLKGVDVLFFSPTEHNTYIDGSVILINSLDPEYNFPQHRNTFKVNPENRFWTSAYPYEVKLRLSRDLQKRYFILDMGEKKIIQ
jgi:L-ascorbate 6-phosphate lactonase